jgi:hypothetical protein
MHHLGFGQLSGIKLRFRLLKLVISGRVIPANATNIISGRSLSTLDAVDPAFVGLLGVVVRPTFVRCCLRYAFDSATGF